jgi:hypothetical protein
MSCHPPICRLSVTSSSFPPAAVRQINFNSSQTFSLLACH